MSEATESGCGPGLRVRDGIWWMICSVVTFQEGALIIRIGFWVYCTIAKRRYPKYG